jgi:hypothetical protein
MFFRFPPDARWNPQRCVVEFGGPPATWLANKQLIVELSEKSVPAPAIT